MKPHVAAAMVQFATQPIGAALLSIGYDKAAVIVEAVGGAGSAIAAYLVTQGE